MKCLHLVQMSEHYDLSVTIKIEYPELLSLYLLVNFPELNVDRLECDIQRIYFTSETNSLIRRPQNNHEKWYVTFDGESCSEYLRRNVEFIFDPFHWYLVTDHAEQKLLSIIYLIRAISSEKSVEKALLREEIWNQSSLNCGKNWVRVCGARAGFDRQKFCSQNLESCDVSRLLQVQYL